MATRLEQIDEKGDSLPPPERWSATAARTRIFSLSSYLRALFEARRGYYRVIVFVITPQPFGAGDGTVTPADARDWLDRGHDALPAALAKEPYTVAYKCTALVYEFERTEDDDPFLRSPGRFAGREHLKRSKILPALGGVQ